MPERKKFAPEPEAEIDSLAQRLENASSTDEVNAEATAFLKRSRGVSTKLEGDPELQLLISQAIEKLAQADPETAIQVLELFRDQHTQAIESINALLSRLRSTEESDD